MDRDRVLAHPPEQHIHHHVADRPAGAGPFEQVLAAPRQRR
jgi:hypothetical protein